jgi:hypothetical protein
MGSAWRLLDGSDEIAYHKILSAFILKCVFKSICYVPFSAELAVRTDMVLWTPLMTSENLRRPYEP